MGAGTKQRGPGRAMAASKLETPGHVYSRSRICLQQYFRAAGLGVRPKVGGIIVANLSGWTIDVHCCRSACFFRQIDALVIVD